MSFNVSHFKSLQPSWDIVYFPETDSTSSQAKLAVKSAQQPENATVFLADQQSSGRGRRGNQWFSSKAKDLLFTVVIESGLELKDIQKMATASALALAQVLEKHGLKAQVKFPNDIYINHKKVAGILIEQIGDFSLIGIGLNVNSEPIQQKFTSLFTELAQVTDRELLLADILTHLITTLSLCGENYEEIRQEISRYDLFFNKEIQYEEKGQQYEGVARGLSDNGFILVEHTSKGTENEFTRLTELIEVRAGHSFQLVDMH